MRVPAARSGSVLRQVSVFAVLAPLMLLSSGCELLVDFDRSLIDAGEVEGDAASDATAQDAGGDGSTHNDAGSGSDASDAAPGEDTGSTQVDSGTEHDSAAQDSGSEEDSGAPHDSGTAEDTGTAEDSGTAHDSGAAEDSGTAHDSGTAEDSGSGAQDSGTVADSGSPSDSGPTGTDSGSDAATLLANGATCGSGGQCQSGACVDTICCATGCTDQGAASCGTNGQCLADGSACATYASGTPCGGTCTAGQQTSVGSCDGHGNCGGTVTRSCTPYVGCAGNVCAVDCLKDADCISGDFCSTGTCMPTYPNGNACGAGDQCTSGACVGNTCCATACTDQGAASCGTNGQCLADGSACAMYPSGTVCAAGSCSAGLQTTSSTCNGTGTCTAGVTASCQASCTGSTLTPAVCVGPICGAGTPGACPGNLICASSTTCLGNCGTNDATGDANCVSGYYCDGVSGGSCQSSQAAGFTCDRASQCASGVCAGSVCVGENVVLLGDSSANSYGAELHPTATTNGTWSTPTTLGAPSVSDLGIAFIAGGASPQAVGIMRYTSTGAPDDQDLVYTTWAPGAFTPFAVVGSGVTTREVPAIAAGGGLAYVAFQGLDFNEYFLLFGGGLWEPSAESIASTGGFPTPPGIAAIGTTATAAFFGPGPADNPAFGSTANDPVTEDRTPSWQPAVVLSSTDATSVATPSIVAMNGGSAELMEVFVRADGAIDFLTRSSGTWAGPAQIPGATAPVPTYPAIERVGLDALPNGGAIATWRDGTTGTPMYAVYAAGTPGSWSTGAAVLATPGSVTLSATPAVAHGAVGATAELAYVDQSGNAFHTRLVGGTWTTPVQVIGGNSLSHVAIATSP